MAINQQNGTAPSLASLLPDSNTASLEPERQASQQLPSLSQAVEQVQSAQQPAQESPQQHTNSPAAEPLQGSTANPVVEQFRKLNFDIPEGMSDSDFVAKVASQIDDTVKIQSEFEKLKAAQEQRAESYKTLATQQPAPATADAGSVLASTPASTPASTELPAVTQAKVSQEATSLLNAGLIQKTSDGWKATSPDFQRFADEFNQADVARRTTLLNFSTDPEEFIKQRIANLAPTENETVSQLQQKVESLEKILTAQAEQQVDSSRQAWVDQNASSLWANTERTELLPLGKRYNEVAKQIDEMAQSFGSKLSPADLHQRTLSILKPDIAAQSSENTQPQPQAPAQEQPSFLSTAKNTAPQVFPRVLTEHPAQQPNGTPQLPRGKGGRPSLQGIIGQLAAAN